MRTFAEWAAHYGYEDTPQARQDYQRYVDQLELFTSTDTGDMLGKMADASDKGEGQQ